ncbi:MAG: DUF262 domain-containing protein [Gammaproteobacteria bacterium]|nr:DUF262 domain-containing protein [Gammaproteobacteria bacterium]
MTKSSLLNADTEDLKELLSNGRSYHVPPYQRDYSWQQEHWEDLWDDLKAAETSDSDHYMGAIVVEATDRKHFKIIDGQQRMATLSILIVACIDYLFELATDDIDAEANRERAALIESSYIGAKDPSSLRITPKLRLNANNDDFYQFNLTHRNPPAGGLRSLTDSEALLWRCFQYFRQSVRDKFVDSRRGEDVARFVSHIVTEKLVFISVRVQDQFSAYTVFETLNARRLDLTETDLLKNYLISVADRLSRSQMDLVLRRWAHITHHAGMKTFPEFLRHHLNSRREYVRQKQLFKTICADITTVKQVFDLLDKLEKDAAWFEVLRDYANPFWFDYDGAREHVRVLNLFNVSQCTPLVLAAKDTFSNPDHVVELLRDCAVISVRFNGVGNRSTHALEEVYNEAAQAIRRGEATSPRAIRQKLRPIYIPDDEFVADFSALRLKNHGRAGKQLRYLLAKIERQLSEQDISDETMAATVEHILPENSGADGWEEFSTEAHDRAHDRIGNYSLLEKKLNERVAGNAAFEEKQIAYGQSRYQTSASLTEYGQWSEAAIAKRQAGLAKVAKSIWSIPL